MAAHRAQLADPAFVAELRRWTAVTAGRADGVPATAGGPLRPTPGPAGVPRDFGDSSGRHGHVRGAARGRRAHLAPERARRRGRRPGRPCRRCCSPPPRTGWRRRSSRSSWSCPGPRGTAAAPGCGAPSPPQAARRIGRGFRCPRHRAGPSPRSSGPRWRRPEREPAAAVGARSPEIALGGVPARSKPADRATCAGTPKASSVRRLSDREHRRQSDPGQPPSSCDGAPAARAASVLRPSAPGEVRARPAGSGPIDVCYAGMFRPGRPEVSARRRRAATLDRPGPSSCSRCRRCALAVARRTTHQSPASTAPPATTTATQARSPAHCASSGDTGAGTAAPDGSTHAGTSAPAARPTPPR